MKILICGGRNYHHGDRVDAVLDALHTGDVRAVEAVLGIAAAAVYERAGGRPVSCVITGAATGADLCGEDWARSRQIPYRGYPARWREHADGCRCPRDPPHVGRFISKACREQGPRRNARMLELEHRPGKPIVMVVAFPGGRGTADMVQRAQAAGIAVVEVP